MKSRIINIGVCLACSVNIFSQSNKIIDLRGEWKFSIGNQDEWAGYWYDDKAWESIKVPSPWENQGFYGYNGYAYYRKNITIPSSYKGYIFYIDLGYIDDVDKVYFNGEHIGTTGAFPPMYSSAYDARRQYYIPENLIRYDQKNVIAVKIYDSHSEGGIVSGNIGIYTSGIRINLDINLQGKWKFKIGDQSIYKKPELDDSHWNTLVVPSYWENQGYKDYDGYAWYRTSFVYKENIDDDMLILMLGKIDDIDEVFVNGVHIGGTGFFEGSAGENEKTYDATRGYYFSKNLLKKNQVNIIAVRVLDYKLGGGIYEGPIGIISQKKYIAYWRKKASSSGR